MRPFLAFVAQDLYEGSAGKLHEKCFVFPNRRAHLFFAKELANLLERPLWMPVCRTVESLALASTGHRIGDEVRLVAGLYRVYGTIFPNRGWNGGFDDFYGLGRAIVHDFDLIDKYLAPAGQVLRNLRDLKQISQDLSFLSERQQQAIADFWSSFNVGDHNTSGLQARFLSIWEKLLPLYEGFRDWMAENRCYYEGALYRQWMESPSVLETLTASEYVFVGFNAINACERRLFRLLQEEGRACFYWDYDPYYITDLRQEAGRFMRDNLRDFPVPESFALRMRSTGFASRGGTTEVIQLPSYVMQAKLLPQLFRKHGLEVQDGETVVVLADESLLSPVLHALPDFETPANVTMGYPFAETPIFHLMDRLAVFYARRAKHAEQKNEVSPDLQDALSLLKDPLFAGVSASVSAKEAVAEYLQCPSDTAAFFARMRQVAAAVEAWDGLHEAQSSMKVHLRVLHKALNQVEASLENLQLDLSVPMAAMLLMNHLRTLKMPFEGMSLQGLQVMGLLETRCLNFKNVIVLAAQEGFLPKGIRETSMLPYAIKRAYGMPSPEDADAMQAYSFYRLFGGAENVFLICGPSPEEGGQVPEVSRFVRQLEAEAKDIGIRRVTAGTRLKLPARVPIEKSKAAFALRLEKAPWYVSPSAMNSYVQCPLKYYYQYIEGIKEPEDETEEVDAAALGSIVHKVLEALYADHSNREMTRAKLEACCQDDNRLSSYTQKAFCDYFGKEVTPADKWPGQWQLVYEVVREYVAAVLRFDRERTPFTMGGVETRCRDNLRVFTPQGERNVLLGGIIDRMEYVNGHPQIVDYKTGSVHQSAESLDALFGTVYKKQNGALLQILTYAYLYHKLHPEEKMPTVRLFFVRDLMAHDTADGKVRLGKSDLDDLTEWQDDFWRLYKAKLEEMLNLELPFRQTPDPQACTYCMFNLICLRNED